LMIGRFRTKLVCFSLPWKSNRESHTSIEKRTKDWAYGSWLYNLKMFEIFPRILKGL